jgi:hypothetical protein
MAKLKPLRLKSKEYVFKAFKNDREAEPAKVVFSRFLQPAESFVPVNRKNLFDGIDAGKIGEKETQDAVSEKIIGTFMRNLQAGVVNYRRFFDECVDHIEHLEYEGHTVVTGNDFWQILPPDAAYAIAEELYRYAGERDEFTMGELIA